MRPLFRTRALALALFAVPALAGRAQTGSVELANLHEDINGLSQRVADLAGRVEVLENRAAAPAAAAKSSRDGVTTAQLNEAISGLTAQIADLRASLPKTARPQADGEAAAEPARTASTAKPGGRFGTNFPHEGTAYVVAKGDTLALIAKKTGAKFLDIVNANQIADPSHIRVGQKLFLPGGKLP